MPLAEWVEPLHLTAWGHEVWTVPPPSQGYLTLAAAWIADGLDLPTDPDDPGWAHLLAEAARQAGYDRPAVLHEHADGAGAPPPRPAAAAPRRHRSRLGRARSASPAAAGDTIYLCAVDGDGMGVSLIQSNAAGWGCHLVVPGTGVFLHNRGIGFSLEAGHPAELAPGPAAAAHARAGAGHPGRRAARRVGTMGGDTQPQVVLQLLARLLHAGQSPGTAVRSPRWALGSGGFDVWEQPRAVDDHRVGRAGRRGRTGWPHRGHRVERAPRDRQPRSRPRDRPRPDGMLAGAADPRALSGAAIGW